MMQGDGETFLWPQDSTALQAGLCPGELTVALSPPAGQQSHCG